MLQLICNTYQSKCVQTATLGDKITKMQPLYTLLERLHCVTDVPLTSTQKRKALQISESYEL